MSVRNVPHIICVLALLALAACGSVTDPEPSATYRLVQLVGQPVPGAEVALSGGERVVVEAAVLELRSDRYIETVTVCTNIECWDVYGTGRYEAFVVRGDGEVTFYPDKSSTGSLATVTDGIITWGPAVYVPIE